MKLKTRSFRTKVARRVFTLFIISAILPVVGFALISFSLVKNQLNEQCLERLHQENKDMAVSLYERLFLFRAEMRMIASSLTSSPEKSMQKLAATITNDLRGRFAGLTLITDKGINPLFPADHHMKPPELSIAEKQHLRSGEALLHQQVDKDPWPRLFMGILLDPNHPRRGILLGEINTSYLWEVADRRPPMSELFIIDGQNNVLFSSLPTPVSFPAQSLRKMNLKHSGQFTWIHKSKKHFVDHTSLFLEPNFFFPSWIVVLSESYNEALSPMENFTRLLPVIIILSIGLVFLLSLSLIRRSMGPIEILQEATQKIADGAFGHEVKIESGDEFESLGRSFNEMSKKLKEGQALLVKTAKLSGIGQMAAGVIHEVKQPLTAIDGLLQLAMLDQLPDKAKERLETALKAVDRLNSILLRFSAFSHPHDEKIEDVSITTTLFRIHQLLEHQLNRKNIHCSIEAEECLPKIRGDSQALEQVFSNLLINSIHALEEKTDNQRLVTIKAYSSDDSVLVELKDTGCGIPDEIQERIFDPFFTTKSDEKGSGLGMAIVASILHKHNATIDFESKVGIGTMFIIRFQASSKQGA